MLDNSSRIGIRGTEDLGGGLKAGFVLEHGFAADTGAAAGSTFWGREAQ
jgi:predicted porin